jgi:hypothetical protein
VKMKAKPAATGSSPSSPARWVGMPRSPN